jgi:phosphatidylserine decarboxylase
MIEVVALLIGNVVQCYSEGRYDHPEKITKGMFLEKGYPKSLFRPGSSTTVFFFQEGRAAFCGDLIANMDRSEVESVFSRGFGYPPRVLPGP